MDGLSAVQARITEIQARFVGAVRTGGSADWASAATAAGLTGPGSASATGTTATDGPASESAVVAEAQKYLGVPYLWGGTDPAKGLDCSGFTQLVFGNLGIDLPRVSAQQATAGRPVASLADARPGDLVFFDHSSRPGIDHVGIYLGEGRMVAAPQAGQVVQVQPVGDPAVIRRVLPVPSAPAAVASPASAGALAGVPYADLFTRAGARHGVDPAVLAAMAAEESGFDPSAVSGSGARGLMQFMPATARELGVDPADPASAVDGAARYLAGLTGRFGSTELGLAAYNAGPGAVSRHGGIPPYAETRSYVRSVLSTAEGYR